MQYKDYLNTEHWQKLREAKLSRKSNTKRRCAICFATDHLDVHHLNYLNLYDVDQSDLRILCRRCHFLAHDLYRQGKIRFRSDNHHSRFAIIKAAVKKHLGATKEVGVPV